MHSRRRGTRAVGRTGIDAGDERVRPDAQEELIRATQSRAVQMHQGVIVQHNHIAMIQLRGAARRGQVTRCSIDKRRGVRVRN